MYMFGKEFRSFFYVYVSERVEELKTTGWGRLQREDPSST